MYLTYYVNLVKKKETWLIQNLNVRCPDFRTRDDARAYHYIWVLRIKLKPQQHVSQYNSRQRIKGVCVCAGPEGCPVILAPRFQDNRHMMEKMSARPP